MKSKLLNLLLTLLGFGVATTACSIQMYDTPPAEYGSPHVDFSVKGDVKDGEGNKLQDIRVVLKPYERDNYENDTTYTTSSGNYELRKSDWTSFGDMTVQVIVEDIDGEDNGGSFAKITVDVPFEKSDFEKGSGNWYKGKAEKTVNFELKQIIHIPDEE